MRILIYAAGAMAAVAAILAVSPARAQTAADVNRLNAAIQICNSPMGQGMPECAKLKGQLGASVPGVGGLLGQGGGGGKLGGVAALLGSAIGAAGQGRAAAAASGPDANAQIQQAIATCMQSANGNQTAIQACLAIAQTGAPAYGSPAPAASNLSAADRAQGAYRACLAVNPNNIAGCTSLLSSPH